MKLTQQIAIVRHRLRAVGVIPDTVVCGARAYDDLIRENSLFRTMDATGQADACSPSAHFVAVTDLHLMDMRVVRANGAALDDLYVGIRIIA